VDINEDSLSVECVPNEASTSSLQENPEGAEKTAAEEETAGAETNPESAEPSSEVKTSDKPESKSEEEKKIKKSKPGEKKEIKRSQSGEKKKDRQPQPKPLMDLRHILKKNEKKVEKAPIQQVDFYGSMSAIPFLKKKKPEKKKKAIRKSSSFDDKKLDKQVSIAVPAADAIASDEAAKKTEEEESVETGGERKSVFYRGADGKEKNVEITIFKEYDEEQLNLWKSMSALDYDMGDRPAQMLPLMPTARPPKERKLPSNCEIGHNRPDGWLNPDLKTPDKLTYTMKDEVVEESPPPLRVEEGGGTSEK
jgi:hypothetical protein